MDAVWLSFDPASPKIALRFTVEPRATGLVGTDTELIVGFLLLMVTLATEVTAGWYPSVTDKVAVTIASSLQLIVGVRVVVPVVVHTVPGPADLTNVHDFVTGSPSGSVTVPRSETVEPSFPAYGPP